MIEYIIWGGPKGETEETLLYTKATTSDEAKRVMKILKDDYGASKLRIHVLDLSKEITADDFVGSIN